MFETMRLRSKIILQVILTIMVLPFLFPLIAMVQESLAGQGWDNYKVVWDTGVVPQFFRNSAIIAAGVIIIVYCLTMLAAFGFSKLHIRGREIYFWMMLVGAHAAGGRTPHAALLDRHSPGPVQHLLLRHTAAGSAADTVRRAADPELRRTASRTSCSTPHESTGRTRRSSSGG